MKPSHPAMKNLLIGFLVAQLSILAPALAAAKSADKTASASSVIASNAADFVARLPAKVFILGSTKEANETTAQGIESLGPTPNTEFLILPAQATRPTPTRQDPPDYPRDAGPGQALIMALISPTGEVTAVHCLAASHPDFARSAAQAAAKWKFKPGKVKDAAVPVLFTQLMEFNIEYR